MKGLVEFLHHLGDLHDCTVTRLVVDASAKTLTFDIEDIYWNYGGSPEYRGPRPGRIVLEGVDYLLLDIDTTSDGKIRLFISEFTAERRKSGFAVTVHFSGPGRIAATCAHATFPAIDFD